MTLVLVALGAVLLLGVMYLRTIRRLFQMVVGAFVAALTPNKRRS